MTSSRGPREGRQESIKVSWKTKRQKPNEAVNAMESSFWAKMAKTGCLFTAKLPEKGLSDTKKQLKNFHSYNEAQKGLFSKTQTHKAAGASTSHKRLTF